MGAATSETTPELGGRGKLDSAKARRIVAAMHASVGRRGAAGSTFDQVAGEAGVSRGLLHYYFGSKERLLAEVVRHDCDVRLGKLDQALEAAADVDAIVDILVSALEDMVERDPGAYALIFELFTASRQNEELREEMAELYRQIRDHVSRVLDAKEKDGVVNLRGTAHGVASVLFAMGDGMALQMLSDPDWNSSETFETGVATARFLLGADGSDS
jgi:AcrR family transcriptional regulator